MTTHDRQKVQSQLDYVGDDALVHATVDRLLAAEEARRRSAPHRPGRLQAEAEREPAQAEGQGGRRRIGTASFQPPEPASFAGQAGGNAANLKDLFEVCVAEGHLVHIADDIYLHADAEAEMRRLVDGAARRTAPALTVAEIRDLLGTTRKYAVPLCEYLDRVGVTRRDGDFRVLAD